MIHGAEGTAVAKLAKENPEIKSAIAGLTVNKVITVAPKLVNFVV
jgi:leucyl-tRNA synthetase